MATTIKVTTGNGSTSYVVSGAARGPAGPTGPAGAGGGGSVTNVATGTGLTGGPIATTGTISLANTAVTAEVYQSPFIKVDAQGRLTKALDEPCSDEIHFSGGASINAGSILTATEIVEWTSTVVSAVARTGIFSGISTGTGTMFTPTYTFSSTSAVSDFIKVTGGGFSHTFNVVKSEIIVQSSTEIITRLTGSVTNSAGTALPTRPAIGILRIASNFNFTLTLKVQKEFLYTGTSPVVVTGRAISLAATTSAGVYTNANITVDATGRVTVAGSGSVAGVTGSAAIQVSGAGVVSLANTAVTPASYTNANITVDAQGRITFADNGSAAGAFTVTAPIAVSGANVISLLNELPLAYQFTSATRPTSSATTATLAAAGASSLITLADGDARYARILEATQLTSETSAANTTTYINSTQCALALGVGTYIIDTWQEVEGLGSTGSAKTKLNWTGTATASGLRFMAGQSTNAFLSNAGTVLAQNGGRLYNSEVAFNFSSNRGGIIQLRFKFVVTVAGTLSIQYAPAVAVASQTCTINAGSFIFAQRIS